MNLCQLDLYKEAVVVAQGAELLSPALGQVRSFLDPLERLRTLRLLSRSSQHLVSRPTAQTSVPITVYQHLLSIKIVKPHLASLFRSLVSFPSWSRVHISPSDQSVIFTDHVRHK